MNEEEKKAIEILKEIKDIRGIRQDEEGENEDLCALDIIYKLIEKQQKEIYQLANGIRVLGTNPDITTEEIIKEFTENPISEEYMEKFKSGYISKDEVLKAIGYKENDEEYDRLKQDNEKLLAILDTMYSEFCRLEDIEDQKVEVAVAFIEEKRDRYWQDKIREILFSIGTLYDGGFVKVEFIRKKLEGLLEE